jgi:hypothetical protein
VEVIMGDNWYYIYVVCPVCGGKIRQYQYFNVCENCYYTSPNSYATNAVIYTINDSGSGVAREHHNPEDLISTSLTFTDCELIKLHHKELDIEFEFDTKKLENIDTIEINGHRFVKEK